MATPAWVRRDLISLRQQRDTHDVVGRSASDPEVLRHARVSAALCRLVIAALLDHSDEQGPQLALAAAWIDALPRLITELKETRPLQAQRADKFMAAAEAQLGDIEQTTTLPGPAVALLSAESRRRRLGPFEDLARKLQHKGAIEALQRHLPKFEPVSSLVDELMDQAVDDARRTGLEPLPDGKNRTARVAVLTSAADAVSGLAMARPWLEEVEDPFLHPGAAILFERVRRRLGAGRALSALDVLRDSALSTESMEGLRTQVQDAVEQGRVARAIELLSAHAPALECARALLHADNLQLNAIGRAVAGVVGRRLPGPDTIGQLDRLRRVAMLSGDPLAEALVAQAATGGDVSEAELLSLEAMCIDAPLELHREPDTATAAAVLARREAVLP